MAPEETDMSEIHARYISRVYRVHVVIGAGAVFLVAKSNALILRGLPHVRRLSCFLMNRIET